jgi:hypothetical protein
MSETQAPSEATIQAFREKVSQFQAALPPSERPFLDALVLLAVREGEFQAFVARLGEFRGTLTDEERPLLDGLVQAACGAEAGDVAGYGWSGVPLKHAALAAAVTLGISAGSLGPLAGTASANDGPMGRSSTPTTSGAVPGSFVPPSTGYRPWTPVQPARAPAGWLDNYGWTDVAINAVSISLGGGPVLRTTPPGDVVIDIDWGSFVAPTGNPGNTGNPRGNMPRH